MQRIIKASYTTCCFCDKPELKEGNIINENKTFKFKLAVDIYCKTNNLKVVQYNTIDKVAIAEMDYKCTHRPTQYIRIEWDIKY